MFNRAIVFQMIFHGNSLTEDRGFGVDKRWKIAPEDFTVSFLMPVRFHFTLQGKHIIEMIKAYQRGEQCNSPLGSYLRQMQSSKHINSNFAHNNNKHDHFQ